MKIKKQISREISRRRRIILLSLTVMILMSYLVLSLNEEKLFTGWELYFAFGYLFLVNGLLMANILRIVLGNFLRFNIEDGRVRIKDGIFRPRFSIGLDKIVYVDLSENKKGEFEILIVMEKGKRNKSLREFGREIMEMDPAYRGAYIHLENAHPEERFYCYILKRGGANKYYYLYTIYKNSYKAEFSKTSLNYIKRFIEEYNLQ